MHKSFIFTDKGGKLNSNIRCIEISVISVDNDVGIALNSNIRCIEITAYVSSKIEETVE